ncbi:carbohydrate kinase family protein [bacterium]|nr:MAG: carbohydrate kinase family protein [bacterium]
MLGEHEHTELVEGRPEGRNLGQHVDAVPLIVHHLADTLHLSRDSGQPFARVFLNSGLHAFSYANATLKRRFSPSWKRRGYRRPVLVLVFGSVCVDRVRRVAKLPAPGGYVEIESERRYLGGEAANTATALRSWGVPVHLAGNGFGEGPEGDELKELVEAHCLPSGLLEDERTGATPVCDVYITPDGERTMFGRGFSGSRPAVDPGDLPYVAGEWFTAEPNMGAAAREAARAAAEAGMKTYLMDFFREDEPIAPGSFWQSSTDWVGTRGNVQRNVEWVRNWADRYGCFTILSDGPNGLIAGGLGKRARHYPPFPAPVVVDTTGAGDMFRAGVLRGLHEGWPLGRSLAYGAAAGCLKCRSFGATEDVPLAEEILAHIAAHPEIREAYLA